jgi:hypothetical protein
VIAEFETLTPEGRRRGIKFGRQPELMPSSKKTDRYLKVIDLVKIIFFEFS